MSALKVQPLPCPFCGHKPTFSRIKDADVKDELPHGFWTLSCGRRPHVCPGGAMSFGDTRPEAIAEWNTRFIPRAKINSSDAAEKFLKHARDLAFYWASQPGLSPLEVAQGVAFSMLVAVDGEALAVGPFSLRPLDRSGNEGEDIAGELHERFHTESDDKRKEAA